MYVMFNVAVLCCNLAFNCKKKRVIFPTSDEGERFWDTLKISGKLHDDRTFDVGRIVSANIGHVS